MNINKVGNDVADRLKESKEVILEEAFAHIVDGLVEYVFIFENEDVIIMDKIDQESYYSPEEVEDIYNDILEYLRQLRKGNGYYEY